MKKIILGLIFVLTTYSLFAAKVTVSPVKTPYNEITTNSNGKLQQTVLSDSGMSITVNAEIEDENLKYTLELDNITDSSFLQKQDTIKTYYGNFEKNEWTENTNNAYSKNATAGTKTESTLSPEEACVLAGATCLCAFTLFEICESSSGSSRTVSPRNVTSTTKRPAARAPAGRPAPAPAPRSSRGPSFSWVIIDPIIVATPSPRRTNPDTYTVTPNENSTEDDYSSITKYVATFYVPAGVGPDYRLRVIVSDDEFIDFYFSRSDRDNVANPFKDRSYGRHSLLISMGIPDCTRFGAYYIYSGKTVGFYTGMCAQINDNDTLGSFLSVDSTSFYEISNDIPPTSDGYSLQNIDPSKELQDYINFNVGLTIKTIPHTWLMLGCGFDMILHNYYGDIYGSPLNDSWNGKVYGTDYQKLATGYVYSEIPEFGFVAQAGVNLIFDHFDIAGTVQYSFLRQMPTFDVMVGVAF